MAAASLKSFFDALPGGFLITDPNSHVVYANEAVTRRTGFAVGEIVGKKPGELWGGRMERAFYQSMWRTIGSERRPFVGKVENRKKGGGLMEDTLHIAPLVDARGIARYFVELHPQFQNEEEARSFSDDFRERADGLGADRGAWSWLVRKLGHREPEKQMGSRDLATMIEEEFVLPTRQVFADRFEDALLIEKAKENPKAFAALYVKYRPSVTAYFLRRVGDPSLAEDLAQETFARAFRYLSSFRITNASYFTYLLHVCHSILVNHYRKQARAPLLLSLDSIPEVAREKGECFPETAEMLLRALGPVEREAMRLLCHEGFRSKEIAQKLGKSENAVKLILSRARKKLRLIAHREEAGKR